MIYELVDELLTVAERLLDAAHQVALELPPPPGPGLGRCLAIDELGSRCIYVGGHDGPHSIPGPLDLQCQAVDELGNRCAHPAGHDGPHHVEGMVH